MPAAYCKLNTGGTARFTVQIGQALVLAVLAVIKLVISTSESHHEAAAAIDAVRRNLQKRNKMRVRNTEAKQHDKLFGHTKTRNQTFETQIES